MHYSDTIVQCQWINPGEYGWISHTDQVRTDNATTTKPDAHVMGLIVTCKPGFNKIQINNDCDRWIIYGQRIPM